MYRYADICKRRSAFMVRGYTKEDLPEMISEIKKVIS